MSEAFCGAFSAVVLLAWLWDLRGRCVMAHRWGAWQQYTVKDVTKNFDGTVRPAVYLSTAIKRTMWQGRKCTRCGLQVKRIV